MEELKARVKAWWQAKIVKNFYKSWTWLASLLALVVTYGPDVANLVIDHIDLIGDTLPTLPAGWKSAILLAAHLFIFFARPIKQKSLEQPGIPVAVVNVPDVIEVGTGSKGATVPVASEVQIQETKT